jgi:hypothetical protein
MRYGLGLAMRRWNEEDEVWTSVKLWTLGSGGIPERGHRSCCIGMNPGYISIKTGRHMTTDEVDDNPRYIRPVNPTTIHPIPSQELLTSTIINYHILLPHSYHYRHYLARPATVSLSTTSILASFLLSSSTALSTG